MEDTPSRFLCQDLAAGIQCTRRYATQNSAICYTAAKAPWYGTCKKPKRVRSTRPIHIVARLYRMPQEHKVQPAAEAC